MRLELGANTKEEIDNSKGLFVYFNVPHDTPEIRQNIRGLILCLAKARYYVVNKEKDVAYKYTAKALDGIEVHFMSDELLNRGVNSLVEIEFTLKHLLASMANNKDVQFFIDKPAEPAIDEQTGEWDLTDNNSITSQKGSVFVSEQYIDPIGIITQKFTIADIAASAFVEGGIVIDPIGQSLFTIKSKFDPMIANVDLHTRHFTGGFTTLMQWFASSFRETPYRLNNPFAENTFYNIFATSFNKGTITHLDQVIPDFLTGWIPDWITSWSPTVAIPVWQSDESYLEKINTNFVTTFNETNTDGVASNSYFRLLHTWLGTDWKLFHDVMNAMKECICALTGAFKNEDGTSKLDDLTDNFRDPDGTTLNGKIKDLIDTIKDGNDNFRDPDGKTLNDKIKDLVDETKSGNQGIEDLIKEIKELIEAMDDNGTTTIDNGNGTYITLPNININMPITNAPIENYPPLDPEYPDGETCAPYKPVQITPRNSHDALCGFTYYYLVQFADFVEWLFDWLSIFRPLYMVYSSFRATKMIVEGGEILNAVAPSGIKLAKIPAPTMTSAITPYFLVAMVDAILTAWPPIMREAAEDFACGVNGKVPFKTRNDFVNTVIGLLGLGVPPVAASYAGFLAGLFWDYNGANDVSNAVIDLNSYAQYCPCPLTGLFNGHFWNGTTGNGEKHLYLESDGVYLAGTVTSIDLFGTLYESEIVNGLINTDAETSAHGTLHVISHAGFNDTNANFYTNAEGNEVSYGVPPQIYTRQ